MAQKKKRTTSRARRIGSISHDRVLSRLDEYAIGVREFYLSLRRAGFPVDQALGIIMDKAAYPDWLTPSTPDFNPINPDHDSDEDED